MMKHLNFLLFFGLLLAFTGCDRAKQQRQQHWENIRSPKSRLVKLTNYQLRELEERIAAVEKAEKEKLKAQLKLDEGLRTKPYFCPAGKLTVGWGRNLEDNKLTPEEREVGRKHGWDSKVFLETLFENDVEKTIRAMEAEFPWAKELAPAKQQALANMIFQMGLDGVKKFERSLAALEVGDYAKAETYLKQSKWYQQTPNRAARVIDQLTKEEGEASKKYS